MIFHVVPLVIAFAVNPRIAVTSRDNQIEKRPKSQTNPDERRSLCRVSTSKIPQKQRFALLIDQRPQIIHASSGDRHAPLTTHAVERDIIFPTPSIHPARAVNPSVTDPLFLEVLQRAKQRSMISCEAKMCFLPSRCFEI